MTGRPWILIEGGGSRTWATTHPATSPAAAGPSTNPRSVGEDHASSTLTELLHVLRIDRAIGPCGIIAAHGAASTTRTAAHFAALIRRAATAAGLPTAPVFVTNDITPLLLDDDGPVCAVIAGTGTGFAARNGHQWARASGLEWLLSDEGGAHDLATAGLRAAVQALDGRGPATALTTAARRWCPTTPSHGLSEDLFTTVYDAPDPKPFVASFAQHVLEAAADGDALAAQLVQGSARELLTGARAVCRATGTTAHSYTLVLSGSLLTATPTLRTHFLDLLHQHLPPGAVRQHTADDHAAALLRLRAIWQDPHKLKALTRALPAHADPPPRTEAARPPSTATGTP
ncbi:BadF/BadG/BcrA/BcrD ATPase family protein [Streptomyces luteireticuli]|uniref:BadF/BadG/BcrA/BcrD ATPase family protein n=1 Tax=Streptomyces luteireticuli TaxID=173858 RepID=UPI0035570C65